MDSRYSDTMTLTLGRHRATFLAKYYQPRALAWQFFLLFSSSNDWKAGISSPNAPPRSSKLLTS